MSRKRSDIVESKEDNDGLEIGSYAEFKPGQKYPTPSPVICLTS